VQNPGRTHTPSRRRKLTILDRQNTQKIKKTVKTKKRTKAAAKGKGDAGRN